MDDRDLAGKELGQARYIIARWNRVRARKVTGALRDTFDRMKFDAERAVIGMIQAFACEDVNGFDPYGLTLDGFRYLVFPEHGESNIHDATLIVQCVETGEEIAVCPGQGALPDWYPVQDD